MPHTDVLPLNYSHRKIINIIQKMYIYVGVIRTLNGKYQKFMTYLLVHNIYKYIFNYLYNKLCKVRFFYYIYITSYYNIKFVFTNIEYI